MSFDSFNPMRRGAALAVVALLATLAPSLSADAQWEFATDVSLDAGGIFVSPATIVLDAGAGPLSTAAVGNLAAPARLAGIHPQGGGDYLYAVAQSLELPGALRVERRDVVQLSGGVESIYFAGASEGVPARAGIDAVSEGAASSLLLSFDVSFENAGLVVASEDLVEIDGGAWSLFFDGSAEGVPAGNGIDGAHYDATSDTLSLSFTSAGIVGGVSFAAEDIVAFERGSGVWTLALDASVREASLARSNLIAVPEPTAGLAIAVLAAAAAAGRGRAIAR